MSTTTTFATAFNSDMATLSHFLNPGTPGAVVVPGPAPSMTDAQINAQLQAANPNAAITPASYAPPAAASTNGLPAFLQGTFTVGNVSMPRVAVYGGAAVLVLLLVRH